MKDKRMNDKRKHGPSANADVIDLAEQKRRNALYVLDILVRAYVPKNTSDWKEMEAALKELSAPTEDAARYRWLREWPSRPTDYINTGLPWVVHIEQEQGVPTMVAFSGERLDGAIDAALAEAKKS